MKKIYPVVIALAIAMSSAALYFSFQSSDYAYVDINKILEGYKRTKIVQSDYEKKAKVLSANVDSLVLNWQKELKIYEKEQAKYTKKERSLKQELLATKQQQISNYQQAVQQQIEEEDQKATQTIINDLNDFIKDYGKKSGFKIIFGAKGSGNIMYANSASDITEEVLEGLNREFEGAR
jgi:outer membrane protein